MHMALTALADLQEIHCRRCEIERRILKKFEELDTRKHLKVLKSNALFSVRRQIGVSRPDTVRSQEELTYIRRRVDGILIHVGVSPNSMS